MRLDEPAKTSPRERGGSGRTPAGRTTIASGADLERAVATLGHTLGLRVRTQVRVARRLWGAERRIDLVLNHDASGRSLGIECKFQGTGGSAEEKIPATIQDIAAWPIPGIVVFEGSGFSANMRAYLHSTGKAVAHEDLHGWLMLFFGLPEDAGAPSSTAALTDSQRDRKGRAGGGRGPIGG